MMTATTRVQFASLTSHARRLTECPACRRPSQARRASRDRAEVEGPPGRALRERAGAAAAMRTVQRSGAARRSAGSRRRPSPALLVGRVIVHARGVQTHLAIAGPRSRPKKILLILVPDRYGVAGDVGSVDPASSSPGEAFRHRAPCAPAPAARSAAAQWPSRPALPRRPAGSGRGRPPPMRCADIGAGKPEPRNCCNARKLSLPRASSGRSREEQVHARRRRVGVTRSLPVTAAARIRASALGPQHSHACASVCATAAG